MTEDKNLKREKIESVNSRDEVENPEKQEKNIEKQEVNFESAGFEKSSVEENQEQLEQSTEKEGDGGLEAESAGIVVSSQVKQQRQIREKEIEKILEKDLEESYVKMPPNLQNEFKFRGEETAKKINELFEKGKVKAINIIDLIKKWLSIIPGVNKYFLEQEAKIKTDEIIKQENNKAKKQ